MYRDSIEDEEGDGALTEVVTGVVSEAVVEEDTVPTGATVAGMSSYMLIRVPAAAD
jgi:hypothetical protein